jgi:hypothetical protein
MKCPAAVNGGELSHSLAPPRAGAHRQQRNSAARVRGRVIRGRLDERLQEYRDRHDATVISTSSTTPRNGSVIFTTRHATLTVTVTGTLELASGEFSASGPVTDATGKLVGATGSLSLDGVQDLTEGTFLEDVTGDVCVDLAR